MRRLAEWPETRAIPVIALSAAALPSDTARAKVSGFFRYLTKPVKIDELMTVLEEILTTGTEKREQATEVIGGRTGSREEAGMGA